MFPSYMSCQSYTRHTFFFCLDFFFASICCYMCPSTYQSHSYTQCLPYVSISLSLYLSPQRERITFKLCLLVYKARNGMAPNYIQDLCVPVSSCQLFLPALLSAPQLVETWSSLVPDDVSGIEHSASPVLQRGTVCRRTFVLHQHSVLSKICSRLIYFLIHFNYQLNFEKRMLYGALVVTLWTCYGAL